MPGALRLSRSLLGSVVLCALAITPGVPAAADPGPSHRHAIGAEATIYEQFGMTGASQVRINGSYEQGRVLRRMSDYCVFWYRFRPGECPWARLGFGWYEHYVRSPEVFTEERDDSGGPLTRCYTSRFPGWRVGDCTARAVDDEPYWVGFGQAGRFENDLPPWPKYTMWAWAHAFRQNPPIRGQAPIRGLWYACGIRDGELPPRWKLVCSCGTGFPVATSPVEWPSPTPNPSPPAPTFTPPTNSSPPPGDGGGLPA